MRLPDFLIIGQMRAGTTSLYSGLIQHPDIYMPELKELRFFATAAKGGTGLPQTLEEYAAHFDQAPPGAVAGEASPQYLEDAGAAERIHSVLPDVRVIATLRNPADRALSLYLLEMRQGRARVSFEAWFRGSDQRRILESVRTCDKLAAYYQWFGQSRVCSIRFDDMAADLGRVAAGVFRFLGVEPDFAVDPSLIHRNSGGVPRSRLLSRAMVEFKRARSVKFLTKRLLPQSAWNLGKRMRAANYVAPDRLSPALREELLEIFADDTRRLQQLTDLDLSGWLPR